MTIDNSVCYYGRLSSINMRTSLVEDILKERKKIMIQEIEEVEIRLKRHITEAKREVMKEIQRVILSLPKSSNQPNKDIKNVT